MDFPNHGFKVIPEAITESQSMIMGNINTDGTSTDSSAHAQDGASRRDFIYMTAGAMAAVGAGAVAWPLVQSMNPAADTLAMSTTEVTLSDIPVGVGKTVMWQGKPVFVRHRSPEEIAAAEQADSAPMINPEKDSARVKKPEWLVVVGVCTHLGCVPVGEKPTENRGEFGGWFCPCHGSQYDTSGRIRKGPAPLNLVVPPYKFLSDTSIQIG